MGKRISSDEHKIAYDGYRLVAAGGEVTCGSCGHSGEKYPGGRFCFYRKSVGYNMRVVDEGGCCNSWMDRGVLESRVVG
jgi:hypothetical protein